jgi:hypothetical protein
MLANPVCKFCILNLKYSFPCSSLLHYWVPYTRASYNAIPQLERACERAPAIGRLFQLLRAPVKGK